MLSEYTGADPSSKSSKSARLMQSPRLRCSRLSSEKAAISRPRVLGRIGSFLSKTSGDIPGK